MMYRWLVFCRLSTVLFTSMLTAGIAQSAELALSARTPINVVIDHYVDEKLHSEQISPAALANETTLVRRLTLDLAGRIPTAAESQQFVQSQLPQKWTWLVDRLLASPDYALHHRNELDTLLLEGNRKDAEWRDYLLQAARENRPWDEMFRQMLAGSEDVAEEKGALGFLKARAGSIDDLTNDTSRLFFGINISCAKCHDHPLVGDWLQDHYFGMLSFFDRTYLTKSKRLAEKHTGQVKFQTTAGVEKQASFMFLSGTIVAEPEFQRTSEQVKALDAEVKRQLKEDNVEPPKPPVFSPRAQLVDVALRDGDNRYFARSIVNRLWARFLGYGLVSPLDQMHSSTPASHPELLDWLSRDLIAHNYDLKRLIRGIVLSNTYARSSRWTKPGEPPMPEYFAVAIPRPLSPRQYATSLMIAGRAPQTIPSTDTPAWEKWRTDIEKASEGFADLIERPTEHFQVSADEALLFSNSERVEGEFLRDAPDRIVGNLRQIDESHDLVRVAFWSIVNRPPEPEEYDVFLRFLGERKDRPAEGVRQVVWALMTNPELRFNY